MSKRREGGVGEGVGEGGVGERVGEKLRLG